MPQPPAENNRPTEHGDVFINGCSDRGSIPLASTFFIIRVQGQEKGLPKKIPRLVKMNHKSRRTPRAMECGSLLPLYPSSKLACGLKVAWAPLIVPR